MTNRLQPMSYGEGQFDSGANPDFQVTSATRNAREMASLMGKLSFQSKLLDRKLQAVDTALASRKEADPVLIEPADDPA